MGIERIILQPAFAATDSGGAHSSPDDFWNTQAIRDVIDRNVVKGIDAPTGFIRVPMKTADGESLTGKNAAQLLTLGKYDHVGDLASRYDRPEDAIGTEALEVAFFNPTGSRLTIDITAEMDSLGLRPLTAHELYALGIAYPDLQRETPLIALGSLQSFGTEIHDGEALSPFLAMKEGKGRGVDVDWSWKNGWTKECRFPVVRK